MLDVPGSLASVNRADARAHKTVQRIHHLIQGDLSTEARLTVVVGQGRRGLWQVEACRRGDLRCRRVLATRQRRGRLEEPATWRNLQKSRGYRCRRSGYVQSSLHRQYDAPANACIGSWEEKGGID